MKTQTDITQEQQSCPTQRVQQETSNGGTTQLVDNRESTSVQRKLQDSMSAATENTTNPIQRKNNTGLPDNLKTGIENLSGYSMDDVKVHYNSSKPAQLQAHAYAQGTDIHLASGQEKYLPHEAWHVVQQKQGRVKPTRQLKSKVTINDDDALEREADVMGGRATQFIPTTVVEPTQLKIKKSIGSNFVQRYKTKEKGLTVAGELHNKSPQHREIEGEFAKNIKKQEGDTKSDKWIWTEDQMPGIKEGEAIKSENPKHLAVSDIDRIKYYYTILIEELKKEGTTSHGSLKVYIKAIVTAKSEIERDLENAGIRDTNLFSEIQDMKNHDFTRYLVLCETDFEEGDRKKILEEKDKEGFIKIIDNIDIAISKLIKDIPHGREISHNFIRSRAMHELANKKREVNGIWLIGQYHVQEIQEHFRNTIKYDLVSIFDFNEDIREYSKGLKGNQEKDIGNRMGEIAIAARLIRSSIDHLKKEERKETDDRFYIERFVDSIYTLNDIQEKDITISNPIKSIITEINNKFAFMILFRGMNDAFFTHHRNAVLKVITNKNYERVCELEELSKGASIL
ncbi:DUF4157 domain-containing protein [Flavobacterium jejuense]|uniref:DUF4157 domain-containing protein n=1 Tax=Flavobacterium jejuense TaxID=1544455 RepID=A0ABX0IKH8_9FLAO|nr:DUF4157 domain-containing protein [Flavobacterium jejuense]NHN24081.1 DUF4157 domain-containing protein [Flavobacterium jejuense]